MKIAQESKVGENALDRNEKILQRNLLLSPFIAAGLTNEEIGEKIGSTKMAQEARTLF